jgi:hypothetical protein
LPFTTHNKNKTTFKQISQLNSSIIGFSLLQEASLEGNNSASKLLISQRKNSLIIEIFVSRGVGFFF